MPTQDLLLARLAIPVAATVVAVLAVRLLGGSRMVAIGVPVGLAAGYAMVPGWSWAPPVDPMDKVAWLAVGGALLGGALDLGGRGRVAPTIVALLWPALGLAWLGGPDLLTNGETGRYRFGEASIVLGLVLVRLYHLSAESLAGPITAAVIAAGIACLGLVGGQPMVAAIGLPLAAAFLGWAACNWPRRRFEFGAAGILGGSGIALVLAAHMAVLTDANTSLVLLVLAAAVFQPAVTAAVARLPGLAGPALRPIVTLVVVAVPAVAAVLLGWLAPGLVPSLY